MSFPRVRRVRRTMRKRESSLPNCASILALQRGRPVPLPQTEKTALKAQFSGDGPLGEDRLFPMLA